VITQIDIASFGSFSGLTWKKSIRDGDNVQNFKRLNILYQRKSDALLPYCGCSSAL